PPIGELLAVDWAPRPKDGWLEGEMLLFVFDGGLLPAAWRERIRLDMDELVNFAFVPVDEVDRLLPPLHARRVAAAARLRRTPHRAGYLEHGEQIPVQTLARGTAGRSAVRCPPDPAPGPELADWPADLGALSVNTRESHG
ncbi:NUDIX hydrolase, partial [Frankia torreyi]